MSSFFYQFQNTAYFEVHFCESFQSQYSLIIPTPTDPPLEQLNIKESPSIEVQERPGDFYLNLFSPLEANYIQIEMVRSSPG